MLYVRLTKTPAFEGHSYVFGISGDCDQTSLIRKQTDGNFFILLYESL